MKLSQLIAALPSLDTPPQSDPDITLITIDSRRVIPGALFVAYPGVSVDGHRFIPDAIERGAVAIMGEHPSTAPLAHTRLPLEAGGPLACAGDALGESAREHLHPPQVRCDDAAELYGLHLALNRGKEDSVRAYDHSRSQDVISPA
jgi:UDP-N-acetylmuramoyl-L-alanyl-D-glutamate--2,6-diaminopimelate ligase